MPGAVTVEDLRLQAQAERERRRREGVAPIPTDDPVAYARDVLRLTPWSKQEQMLHLVMGSEQAAVRAGRKVSKSNSVAVLALFAAHAQGRPVLITSSSYTQLKAIIWSELRNLAKRAKLPTHVPLDPHTGMRFPSGGSIIGVAVDAAVNIQGYSGVNSLFLVDEASGVRRETIEALQGNIAGGGNLAMFGNPNLTVGPFYDAFHDGGWEPLHLSAYDSPNITGEVQVPGLATIEWIQRMEAQHGKDSAFAQVHIHGQFPTDDSNAVIPLHLVEAAYRHWREEAPADVPERVPFQVGVDPAYMGGDRTVIWPTLGQHTFAPIILRSQDTTEVAGHVLQVCKRLRRHRTDKPRVRVDVIGVGAGVYDQLKRHGDVLVAEPVNVAMKATSSPKQGGYRKLRDQLWFALRDWLAEGGTLPPKVDGLTRELVAPTYSFDPSGRYVVASKDDLREILGGSPDLADALALAVGPSPYARAPVGISASSHESPWAG